MRRRELVRARAGVHALGVHRGSRKRLELNDPRLKARGSRYGSSRCWSAGPADGLDDFDVVPVDRPRVDRQLEAPRDLPEQLPRPVPYGTGLAPDQHRVTILRDPDQVVLAIPDRVASLLVVLHPATVSRPPRSILRLKARGLRIPKGGL